MTRILNASDWKQYINSLETTLNEQKFRNGVSAIAASSIGEQYYCEMKVEQSYLNEEIETEEKTRGDVLHEELLPMKESSWKEVINNIQKRKSCIVAFPLAAKVDGVTLVGQPDAVLFQNRNPTHVIELKTTRGSTTIVYEGQKAQASIYGLLLDGMGFDCSKLKLVIVKFRQTSRLGESWKEEFLSSLATRLVSESNLDGIADSLVIHSFAYARASALAYVTHTKGYWLKEREPIPTTNPNKCRACEFRELCPSSLAKSVW
ncbi:MAG: PD-(D/E)XK nuclease family protein [Thaumarchaeota archaeon]|nr:PD-(D/E)XK nuclease family protein [Nitrososphaerota archaeon]